MRAQAGREQRINEEVLKTLQSLDSLEDIEAGPTFFARLQKRIAARERRPVRGLPELAFSRPLRWALLTLVLMLALNAGTGWIVLRGEAETGAYRATGSQAIADDYSLSGRGTLSGLTLEH
jgi:hypothetical protein